LAHYTGPFTIQRAVRGRDRDFAIVNEHDHIMGEAYGRVDTMIYPDAEANARLWAASPNLLAAAEAVVDAIYQGKENIEDASLIEGLAQAIAAAKGGE
jgi:hypothetical protein